MTDNQFLTHFITEPVYVIPEQNVRQVPGEIDRQENSGIFEEAAEVYTAANPELVFKGSNHRKIAIIVDQPGDKYISPATEGFLSKILAALQLTTDDAAIVNIQSNPDLTKEMLLTFDAEKYLAFGVNGFFNHQHALYDITEMANDKSILSCASLDDIAKDPTQKKQLWSALQKMFF